MESLVFLPTHMFVYIFFPYLPKLQREVIWVDWWSNWGTPEILYERGFRCLEVLQACHFLCKPSVFSTQDHAQGRCSLSSWLHLQKATSGVKFLPQNLPDTSKQPPFFVTTQEKRQMSSHAFKLQAVGRRFNIGLQAIYVLMQNTLSIMAQL